MLHQPQNIRRVHKSSHSKPSHPKTRQDDSDPKGKTKDAPIKVILSLFGLLIVVFIMFSVFQPKKNRPPDRPPLKVFYDKQQFRHDHSPPGNKNNLIDVNDDNIHRLIDINKHNHNKDAQEEEEESDSSFTVKHALENIDPFKNEFNDDSIASDKLLKSKKRDSESADIQFIDSGNPKEEFEEFEIEILEDEIEDLYAKESNPPRPPKSIYIDSLIDEHIEHFWRDEIASNDIFDSTNIPGLDSNGHIYIMNYIFLPYEQMLSIFLLTSEYLNPNHGLHSWPSKRRRQDLPILYKNIRDTIYSDYKSVIPTFACIFRVNSHIWISKVDFVPNNTTRDRYVNYGTEILRCNVPMNEINKYYDKTDSPFYNEEYKFTFLLTQKWEELIHDHESESFDENIYNNLVHISLSFEMGIRSGIKLLSLDSKFMFKKANQNRYLTLCMPPISEPMAFIAEAIAHYINNIGIEHIYIATFFQHNLIEEYNQRLIDKLQPWYDRGLITIWPHEQPWIGFTDKAKSHWLNQCLYYVKSRDKYTVSLDADEFLVLNSIDKIYTEYNDKHNLIDEINSDSIDEEQFEQRAKLMQSQLSNLLQEKINEFDDNHWCWFTFQSFQMWKLYFENENFMIKRFIGREQKAQLTWSKVIWNNKHLHYTGYHAGGSCSAQKHNWKHIIYDWRERKDPKYVYRFDPDFEGGLLHYYNCRQIRIEPKDSKLRNPWSKLVNDTRMTNIYWYNIKKEFDVNKLKDSYPDDISDVLKTRYYRQHYGENNNMVVWHENLNSDK
eukprot:177789_1